MSKYVRTFSNAKISTRLRKLLISVNVQVLIKNFRPSSVLAVVLYFRYLSAHNSY